jgi:putative membrane protein
MMDGMGGWWMGAGSLIFVVLVVMVVLLWMRQDTGAHASRTDHSAENILSERFARGEIDEDEYRRRRAALHD